jgi:predicted O-methyltransferase YrrM
VRGDGTHMLHLESAVAMNPHMRWRSATAICVTACYDFIYIDGSHVAIDVMFDAVCSMRLLAPHGIMCFDDYIWNPGLPEHLTPRPAIDAFVRTHIERVEVICPVHRQVWVRSLSCE